MNSLFIFFSSFFFVLISDQEIVHGETHVQQLSVPHTETNQPTNNTINKQNQKFRAEIQSQQKAAVQKPTNCELTEIN